MFTASNIHYELADKVRGLSAAGVGPMHLLARRNGQIFSLANPISARRSLQGGMWGGPLAYLGLGGRYCRVRSPRWSGRPWRGGY